MTTNDAATDRSEHDDLEARLRVALRADAEQYTPDPDLEDRIAQQALTAPVVDLPSQATRSRLLLGAAAAIVVALVIGSVAIRRSDTTTVDMMTPGSSLPGTTDAPSTTAPAVTPTPTPPSTSLGAVTSVATPTTTSVIPSIVTSTTSTSTTASTAPATGPGRILRTDGVGDAAFGSPTSTAEQALTVRLGPPLARFTDPGCGAQQIITWGSFAIWDRGGALTQWQLIGDDSLGLTTTSGIGIGSTPAEIVGAYPKVDVDSLHQPERLRQVGLNDSGSTWVWAAALDANDRVAGMLAAGSVSPEVCPGHGLRVMDLARHAQGLGIVPIGAPRDQVNAVLTAAYGPGTVRRETRGGGGCFSWVDMGYPTTNTDLVVSYEGDVFVGYVERVALDAPITPVGLSVAEGRIDAGMRVADLRTVFGERLVFGGIVGEPAEFFSISQATPEDPQRPSLVGLASGTGDDAMVVAVGARRTSTC